MDTILIFNKILILGDIHGSKNYKYINELIKIEKPDLLIQTGDFGLWPRKITYIDGQEIFIPENLELENTKLFIIDGNHEHFPSIIKYTKNINEIYKNIFYIKRGTILKINNYNILFMGGALSIDRHITKENINWFREEIISYSDINNLDLNTHVNIVISHTCPNEFKILPEYKYIKKDSSQDALSFILNHYYPSRWFFSHFHTSKEGYDLNCKWKCLNKCNDENWWTEII